MHHYSQIIDKLNEKALSLLEKNRKTEAFSIVN